MAGNRLLCYARAPTANTCPKKRSLLLAWRAATQAYSEAVSELAEMLVTVSADEYERLRKEIDRTRSLSADTRNGFELHVEEHGC